MGKPAMLRGIGPGPLLRGKRPTESASLVHARTSAPPQLVVHTLNRLSAPPGTSPLSPWGGALGPSQACFGPPRSPAAPRQ